MNNNPKVSIIIPAYNCEKYIENSINSLLNQTYENIEVIVVNDGSTDNTQKVSENFGNSIKLINKENGGVSSARNRGIEEASGELIAFLDSDDEYLPIAIENMVKEFEDDTQLLTCSFNKIWIKTHSEIKKNVKISKSEFLEKLYDYYLNFNFVWGNLYIAEIIKNNGVKFNEGLKFDEDYAFNLSYIKCCDKCLQISDTVVYNYYICRSNPHGTTNNPERSINMVIDFYGGKDNMPKHVYNETVKKLLRVCVRRYAFWFDRKKAAQLVEKQLTPALRFADDEILNDTFNAVQVEAIKNGDFQTLIDEYIKSEKPFALKKFRYQLSRFAASNLDKIRGRVK